MKPGRRSRAFLAFAATIFTTLACSTAAQADNAEAIFREARAYTVRVRTQIDRPFIEDVRGSFQGAGFVVDAKRGWILTNAHVVGRSPAAISVAFADEPFVPAERLYVDSFTDMAVLVVPSGIGNRKVAPITCDAEVVVGEAVGAFGHPLGIPFTGSRGIISGKTDQFGPDLLQTDATVDHGNSGGPIIRLRDKRVIGIATAGAGGSKADRINFATPMKNVCRILEILREGGRPEPPKMGVALLEDEDGRCSMRVGTVFNKERWPLEPGDQIVGIAEPEEAVNGLDDLTRVLRGRTEPAPLLVERNGKSVVVEVHPEFRARILERRAVVLDGAVIAPQIFDDGSGLEPAPVLAVHSVDPGSSAEALQVEEGDLIDTIDGRRFHQLDALIAHLRQREHDQPMTITFRRWGASFKQVFDYHVRELPAETFEVFGPNDESVTIAVE